MQRGKIFRKGSSWHLRHKTFRIVGGKKVWSTTSTKLADVDNLHRTQESVEQEALNALATINAAKSVAGPGAPTFKEQALIWLERCEKSPAQADQAGDPPRVALLSQRSHPTGPTE